MLERKLYITVIASVSQRSNLLVLSKRLHPKGTFSFGKQSLAMTGPCVFGVFVQTLIKHFLMIFLTSNFIRIWRLKLKFFE